MSNIFEKKVRINELTNLRKELMQQGNVVEEVKVLKELAELTEDVFGEESDENIKILNEVGGTLKYMGSPHEVSESARGHVWQIDISRNDLERLKQPRRVVSVSNLSEDMAKVRFTGNPIGKGEAPVSPTLEDAYVYQATQCYVNDAL